jgi:hypothetical protein
LRKLETIETKSNLNGSFEERVGKLHGGERLIELKISEEQLQALKNLYVIIDEARKKVTGSEAMEIIEDSRLGIIIGTWALETDDMLRLLNTLFDVES